MIGRKHEKDGGRRGVRVTESDRYDDVEALDEVHAPLQTLEENGYFDQFYQLVAFYCAKVERPDQVTVEGSLAEVEKADGIKGFLLVHIFHAEHE